MVEFEEPALRRDLGSLSGAQRLAFIILLCQRMMPALDKFAAQTNFNGLLYRRCLDEAWRCLAGGRTLSNHDKVGRDCFDGAPNTEDFQHPLTSAALNAALSVAALASFLADHNIDHIVEAAELARETAASYAQSVGAIPPRSLDFSAVMKHPLVQEELLRQAEDLSLLQSLATDVPQELSVLVRRRAEQTARLLPPGN